MGELFDSRCSSTFHLGTSNHLRWLERVGLEAEDCLAVVARGDHLSDQHAAVGGDHFHVTVDIRHDSSRVED